MSIPGIAAMDRSLPDGAPGLGIGMVMLGIMGGAWSDGAPPEGAGCGDGCGLDMSIPGIDCGNGDVDGGEAGAGVPISIPGIAPVWIGFGAGAVAFTVLCGASLRRSALRFPSVPRWGSDLGSGLGFAAGLAGIFMPAMLCADAMSGSIATAAAAANHVVLIIE
jgi:hypothetical protein